MIGRLFHAWERRLAAVTTDRVIRDFDWGVDWLDNSGAQGGPPGDAVASWSARVMKNTDQFFETPHSAQYRLKGNLLSFPSALHTPDDENNTAYCQYQPADSSGEPRRAVVVLPHWNAGPDEHMGLSRLIARFGISALRLSLPYHDRRMPPHLQRADYIVSPNIARTVAGLSPSRTGCPARGALASRSRLRSHWHPRDQPRVMPGDAYRGP